MWIYLNQQMDPRTHKLHKDETMYYFLKAIK